MKFGTRCIVLMIVMFVCSSALRAQDVRLLHRERYKLHVGDTLSLDYRLSPELNQIVTIGPDGFVDLNVAGAIHLQGLTMAEAHDLIVARGSEHLNNPELNLQLKDFQRPYVVVAGQVQTPAKIEMREDMTALQAVMLAGGFRDSAKETRIVVYRRLNARSDMAEVRVLNLHRITKTAQLEQDFTLEAGDIIYVPENNATQFGKIMRIPNFSLASGVPLY